MFHTLQLQWAARRAVEIHPSRVTSVELTHYLGGYIAWPCLLLHSNSVRCFEQLAWAVGCRVGSAAESVRCKKTVRAVRQCVQCVHHEGIRQQVDLNLAWPRHGLLPELAAGAPASFRAPCWGACCLGVETAQGRWIFLDVAELA